MDPLTILALAKGSYEAIKTGVKLGKEVQSMFRDISNLMDSASKLTKLAANPPKPKLFGKESAEKLAMDAYMAKREVEKMFAEAKNLFISEQGLQAYRASAKPGPMRRLRPVPTVCKAAAARRRPTRSRC